MTILRKNLKEEMSSRGWNATVLSERSGVPQPTIQRFLSGTHGDPRSSTIQKLAKGLGTTEAVLRGFEEAEAPIPLYEKIEKLSAEDRATIELMVDRFVQSPAQPSPAQPSPAQPSPAQPSSRAEQNRTEQNRTEQNIGQKEPVQQAQSQDRRVIPERRPKATERRLSACHQMLKDTFRS